MQPIILFKLQHQYQQVETLVQDLSVDFIQQRHRPQKWSILENLAHLGRYQEISQERITQILQEDHAVFGRYRAEEDPGFEPWLSKSFIKVIAESREKRAELRALITALEPSHLLRQGHHPHFGALSIKEWLEFFVLHESHHIYTIFRMIHAFK